jgi:hypothetical protein
MKWEIAESTPNKEVYELWHKERKLLSLDFHPFTSSARIEYADEKRVFLIRKEGFLRNKTVLCNEYGVRLGQMLFDNKENVIELNKERFVYIIQHNPSPELVIYKESKDHPLVVCGLNIKPEDALPIISKNERILPSGLQSSLLLALCWYMFQPVAKETAAEYA